MLDIKKWQLPRVIAKGKKGVAARMHSVKVFDDMPRAIKDLRLKDYKIYILSTNNKDAINTILSKYDLNSYITRIYAGTRLFGKAKGLSSLIRKEHLDKDACVYIGDEVRDVEATKQIGIKCIAVEWGYSAPEALKSYKPEALIAKPSQLTKAVDGL